MHDARFFPNPPPLSLGAIAAIVGAKLVRGNPTRSIRGAGPLESAAEGEISFLDNPKYLKDLVGTSASACLCAKRYVDQVPVHVAVLETAQPYRAYSLYLAHAYPTAIRPAEALVDPGAQSWEAISPEDQFEDPVFIHPGATIGKGAEIGRGTVISAGAVIGPGVAIGRDCFLGANTTIQHALIGDRVIIHPGARIGQDGFGFVMGPQGHFKVAQIGRVIIQDDVEIGANTTIDRGANRDTIIGEGTKIDNQVQIGHNVEVGRHCILVAQVGIAGSARLGDFVAIGGQSGVNGHVRVGDGAQIAGVSVVHGDVPPGARWGGVPARPVAEWFREIGALRRLAQQGRSE